jgi:hypothetical protein
MASVRKQALVRQAQPQVAREVFRVHVPEASDPADSEVLAPVDLAVPDQQAHVPR